MGKRNQVAISFTQLGTDSLGYMVIGVDRKGKRCPPASRRDLCRSIRSSSSPPRLPTPSTARIAGVTHRDVKPQNIMLTLDGMKVLDFRMESASSKPGSVKESLTKVVTAEEGTVVGTSQ